LSLRHKNFKNNTARKPVNLRKHLNKTESVCSFNKAVQDIEHLRKLHKTMDETVLKAYGWIYLGKYNFNAHRWSTTTVDSEAIPGKGDSITLIGSVHFRDNKPSGLFYRKGNLKNPPVLPAGTTVMVKEVDEKIGLGNYSWALVEANIPH